MSKDVTLITLGVLVALSPFLGLPLSVLAFVLPILGIITFFIGYTIRKERVAKHTQAPVAAPIVSNDTPSAIA